MASKTPTNESNPHSPQSPLKPSDPPPKPLLLIFDLKKATLYFAKPSEELYQTTFAHPMPRWHDRVEIYRHPESRTRLIAVIHMDIMMSKRDNWWRKMHYKEVEFRVKGKRSALLDEVMDEEISEGRVRRYC